MSISEVREKIVEIAANHQMAPKPAIPPKPFTQLNFTEERRNELKQQAAQVQQKQT